VGIGAATTHLLSLFIFVDFFEVAPLFANPLAWMAAVVVSFAGQRWLTFRPAGMPEVAEVGRFVLVSFLGLLLNQLGYAAMLIWLPQHYLAALVPVIAVVAVVTFVLNRYWVFSAHK